MKLTIIVPAFNEEAYLASTLESIQTAAAHLRARVNVDIDMIVVDNNSDDETADVARDKGAMVAHEPVQGVARARNTGARHAEGDVLVFVDADVIVPPNLLEAIHAAMNDLRRRRCGCRLPAAAPFHEALPAHVAPSRAPHGDGARRHAVLSKVRIRTSRGLRREGVDRRGCRLLLEPQEIRQGKTWHGPIHTDHARPTVLPSLRQVADVEGPDLDQPSFHRILPPPEEVLERLVLTCGEVDCRLSGKNNDRHDPRTDSSDRKNDRGRCAAEES